MGVVIDGFHPPSSDLQRNQWCTFPFLPQQRFSSFSEYTNHDQRLCLPLIPARVRCLSMEDLLNTRSRVICSSFVSLA